MASFTNTTPPTITGSRVVGGTITASVGTWTPTPATYSYQWERSDDAAGTNNTQITGATGATYTIDTTDTNKFLRVGVYPGAPTTSSAVVSAYSYTQPPLAWNPGGGNLTDISDRSKPMMTQVRSGFESSIETLQTGVNKNPLGARYWNLAVSGPQSALSDPALPFASVTPNPAWWIHNSAGTILLSGNQSTNYIIDPHGLAVTNGSGVTLGDAMVAHITSVMTSLAPHCNALWYDNVGPDYRQWQASGTKNIYNGYSSTGSHYTVVDDNAVAAAALYQYVNAKLQQAGFYIVANSGAFMAGGGDGTALPWVADNATTTSQHRWWDYLTYPNPNTLGPGGTSWRPGSPCFDAFCIENWMVVVGVGHPRRSSTAISDDYWDAFAEFQTNCQARIITLGDGSTRPCAFHGQYFMPNATPTPQDLINGRYSYASFLLNYDGYPAGNSLHMFYNAGNCYRSEYGTNITMGNPTAAKYEVQNGTTANSVTAQPGSKVWRRNYGAHLVILNTQVSTSVTFTSGDYAGHTIGPGDSVIV